MDAELDAQSEALDKVLAAGEPEGIRLDPDGRLIVPRLSADEVPDETSAAQILISDLLLQVDLAEVLVDIDHMCGLSDVFTHPALTRPCRPRLSGVASPRLR